MVIMLWIGQSAGKESKSVMIGYDSPSTTECIQNSMPRVSVDNDGLINLNLLKIQSSPLWKQRYQREGRSRDGQGKPIAVVNLNFYFITYLKTKADING